MNYKYCKNCIFNQIIVNNICPVGNICEGQDGVCKKFLDRCRNGVVPLNPINISIYNVSDGICVHDSEIVPTEVFGKNIYEALDLYGGHLEMAISYLFKPDSKLSNSGIEYKKKIEKKFRKLSDMEIIALSKID